MTMLHDKLYTLGREEDSSPEIRFRARINPAHPLFAGHFPGRPVLPGVCTLAILRDCLGLAAGRPVRFSEIRDCKFTAPVDPARTQTLDIRIVPTGSSVQATVSDGATPVLKLKATCIPRDV